MDHPKFIVSYHVEEPTGIQRVNDEFSIESKSQNAESGRLYITGSQTFFSDYLVTSPPFISSSLIKVYSVCFQGKVYWHAF